MRLLVILALAGLLAGAAPAAEKANPDLAGIEGVYKRRFPNATIQGEEYESEDILEIVPVGPDLAYFRAHLEFYNGHVCDLYGMAEWRDGALVYEEPEADGTAACRLRLEVKGGDITFVDDPDMLCANNYCGARGGFNGAGFTAKQKRTIRYMDRLLRSNEYATAKELYDARPEK